MAGTRDSLSTGYRGFGNGLSGQYWNRRDVRLCADCRNNGHDCPEDHRTWSEYGTEHSRNF